MNFYTQQHKHYCGIDLHARAMYVCILDQHGTKLVHKNLPTTPEAFLRLIAPYREDLVVGVEGIFTWYWLADQCQQEGIAFVLGHALSMKAISPATRLTRKLVTLRWGECSICEIFLSWSFYESSKFNKRVQLSLFSQ
jgi:hypothetical protein